MSPTRVSTIFTEERMSYSCCNFCRSINVLSIIFIGHVALIQISDPQDHIWIVFPYACRETILSTFVPQVLNNPAVLRIGCGIDNDVLMDIGTFGSCPKAFYGPPVGLQCLPGDIS